MYTFKFHINRHKYRHKYGMDIHRKYDWLSGVSNIICFSLYYSLFFGNYIFKICQLFFLREVLKYLFN
jgi:hypothetical protein